MKTDVLIVGAGAAGLMAGIWAGRKNPNREIIIVDGAKKPGTKILVAGGGRCNVTHYKITSDDFAGSSRHAINKILKRFNIDETLSFFKDIGVELKQEKSGKLFPVSDKAHTVRQALFSEIKKHKVELIYPFRVQNIQKRDNEFIITSNQNEIIRSHKVILATGGKSLPKSGSDGHGYDLAKSLGHSLTKHIFPSLVPLTLPGNHFINTLSGITLNAKLEVRNANNKILQTFTDSTLFTHFGLSGPSVLNISRYYKAYKFEQEGINLFINFAPGFTYDEFKSYLEKQKGKTISAVLKKLLPDRLISAICSETSLSSSKKINQLSKKSRKDLIKMVTEYKLPISGDRGFKYAEVTAGGIPLSQVNLKTMESRICKGLYFCGEICDVDGRIGGFNFQWAWSSGYTAGISV